jgi:thiamine biosynthesis lipoprotein
MGSTAHVVVEVGESDAVAVLDQAQELVEALEAKWTRFSATSELSEINDNPGIPVRVSSETFGAIALAVDGWRTTAGRFDATVGTAMDRIGYDRSFAELQPNVASVAIPASGWSGVVLDEDECTVVVPTSTRLDLGGIGKGYAADLVARHLHDRGVVAACVNLGGDARFTGGSQLDGGWKIEVEHPFDATRSVATLAVADGGIATSARTRRRWKTSTGDAHHLVDPTTGMPARTGLAQVTVLAADGAWAEMMAKAAFLAGCDEGPALVASSGTAALFVTDCATLLRAGGIGDFER